jgi:hypothetical protein
MHVARAFLLLDAPEGNSVKASHGSNWSVDDLPMVPLSEMRLRRTGPLVQSPRADLRQDAEPDKADGHRVPVLAHRDHRFRVDPGAGVLSGLRSLLGQRPQQRPFSGERFADRPATTGDLPSEIPLAAAQQPRVQLGEAAHRRDRDEVPAAEPADLALDPTLLMRATKADQGELRLRQVVRPQPDEPVRLDPSTTPQDLLDRRGQIVASHQAGNATEELERVRVRLQERLLRLAQERARERRAGVT